MPALSRAAEGATDRYRLEVSPDLDDSPDSQKSKPVENRMH
jgi:hypothetical protein